MNIKDMIGAMRKSPLPTEPPVSLETIWGESIDTGRVLWQHPRPQLLRKSYENLNGYWRYAITSSGKYPKEFDGLILVPFSPESRLSGVERQLLPHEYLWYERTVDVDDYDPATRCIIYFEAVDQCAAVYINGKFAQKHIGGYVPFNVDITPWLKPGKNRLKLTLRVQDFSDETYHSHGKQRLEPSGMYYTAQSGIWQTVWLERVPEHHMVYADLVPDYDKNSIKVSIHKNRPDSTPLVRFKVYEPRIITNPDSYTPESIESEQPLLVKEFGTLKFTTEIPSPKSWSPKTPYLYPVEITSGYDTIFCYFAMRKFSVEKDENNTARICINHENTFLNGVLDQGYWPEGLYTPPTYDALYYDVQKMKDMGFNMLRKHCKIELRRWYFYCDCLGMVVWQDMVNGGEKTSKFWLSWLPTLLCVPGPLKQKADAEFAGLFERKLPGLAPSRPLELKVTGRVSEKGRQEFWRECLLTLSLLRPFPSIMTWVLFNEGWGQFNTVLNTELMRAADPDRLVDAASGWIDLRTGDFKSVHNYFRKLEPVVDERAYVLSEYGGYVHRVPDHCASSVSYGYRKFDSQQEFEDAFCHLLEDELEPLIEQGLCAAVYTQLSDIEEETNGLLTWDRKVCKLSKETIEKIKRLS